MQLFLNSLHEEFRDDILVVVCDGAAWHKSSKLEVPENMTILHIPPYTPEMNPIEQIWRELRTQGFRNEVFATLEKVVNRLCETIRHLSKIQSSVLLVGNGFGAFLIGNSIKSKFLPCQRRDDRVQMLFALRQQRIPDHQFTSFIIRISSS